MGSRIWRSTWAFARVETPPSPNGNSILGDSRGPELSRGLDRSEPWAIERELQQERP